MKAPHSIEESQNHLLHTNWKLINSLTTLHTQGLSKEDEQFSTMEMNRAIASITKSESVHAPLNAIREAKVKLNQLKAKKDEATRNGDDTGAADLQYYDIPETEALIKRLEKQAIANIDYRSPLGSTEVLIAPFWDVFSVV